MRRECRPRPRACAGTLAAALLLAVGGCALTREPLRTPELPLPAALPVPEAAVDLPQPWWTLFGDATLDALVREALARNADLAVAAARVAEARALAGLARADRLPALDLEATVARGRDSRLVQPGLPEQGATRTDYVVRGVAAWELDFWGRYAHASEAARARLLASELDREALRLSLTGATARAYFALAAAVAQHAQARATLESREESVRIERLRFDGGESDELTFRRVEAEAAQARALIREFELAVEQSRNALGVLLGRSPHELVAERLLPRALSAQPALPALPAGLPAELLARRPDVRAAEARIAAAAGDVGAARAALLPGLRLTGAWGSASPELDALFTTPGDAWSVAASLVQPVFQGGRLRAGLARQRALHDASRAEYLGTVQAAFRELLDGLQGQQSLRALEAARATRVESLRRAGALAGLRYDEGEISYLELLDVRRELLAAEIDLVAARRAALENTVDLALALAPPVP